MYLRLCVQESVRLVIRSCVGQEVDSGEASLLPARHEHDDGLAGRVLQDGVVGGLGHGHDPARVVRHVEALDVELQRHRPHVRVEVEGAVGGAAEPLGHVAAVGEAAGQGHHPHRAVQLRGDVAHPRAHDLQHRPVLAAQQLQLVHDEELHVLDIPPLLPASAEHVPLLWQGDDDVALGQQLEVNAGLLSEDDHLQAQAGKPVAPAGPSASLTHRPSGLLENSLRIVISAHTVSVGALMKTLLSEL